MRKIDPPDGYPPEDGRYLRGNDYSSVAVVAILNQPDDQIPERLKEIVKKSVETGAALAGMLQTENIGIEKTIANVISNPNIRYIVLCGIESRGHLTGDAFIKLFENGVDDRRRIVGTEAPTPYLYNMPKRYIGKFRRQVKLINLLGEASVDIVKDAVRSCYQEEPTRFKDYELRDPGAFHELPICREISMRVEQPWAHAESEEEYIKIKRIKEKIRKRGGGKKYG